MTIRRDFTNERIARVEAQLAVARMQVSLLGPGLFRSGAVGVLHGVWIARARIECPGQFSAIQPIGTQPQAHDILGKQSHIAGFLFRRFNNVLYNEDLPYLLNPILSFSKNETARNTGSSCPL